MFKSYGTTDCSNTAVFTRTQEFGALSCAEDLACCNVVIFVLPSIRQGLPTVVLVRPQNQPSVLKHSYYNRATAAILPTVNVVL